MSQIKTLLEDFKLSELHFKIKQLCKERDKPTTIVSELAGYNSNFINKLRNKTNPKTSELLPIAEVLGCELKELLDF